MFYHNESVCRKTSLQEVINKFKDSSYNLEQSVYGVEKERGQYIRSPKYKVELIACLSKGEFI